ncbi:O-antigen ligase family protein [Paenibacillus pasadenensis]|uniref:O-antigen ligase family protein n=1 Tax=Paenibacillus TaxID=44249 RepID=UPI00041B1031|nr:O-antigen ligase family protein [Paenibacillus pasadenensis]
MVAGRADTGLRLARAAGLARILESQRWRDELFHRLARAAGLALLLSAAFRRSGWFFDRDGHGFVALLAAFGLAAFLRGDPGGWRLAQGSRGGRLPLAAACCIGLALLYAARSLGSPVSVQGSVEEALRWLSFGSLALVLAAWQRKERRPESAVSATAWALQGFSAFAAASSLAAWCGWIVGPDFMLRTADGRLSATGARLAGYLQYSNALGAFAAALLAWQWLVLARSGSPRLRRSAAWLAPPCLAVLLLSESRGALLALLAAAVPGLLLARRLSSRAEPGPGRSALRAERLRWLLAAWSSLPGAAALVAIARFRERSTEAALAQDAAVWLALLAASAAGAFWIKRTMAASSERLSQPATAAAAGPAAVLHAGIRSAAVLLLGAAAALSLSRGGGWDRFDPAEPTSAATGASRLLLYRGGWAAARESWLLGYGARAWELLRGSFQSAPYAAGEVHSGYLDMLLTAGAPGLALLLALGAALLAAAGAKGALGAVPAASLLLHAAIDVDMCYGAYWLLLLVLSAAGASLAPPASAARTEGGDG